MSRILGLILSCGLLHAAQVNFRAPQTISLSFVTGAAYGDFRGTGRQDLIAVDLALQLYPNMGHGQFGPPTTILSSPQGTAWRAVAADFNRDGKLDVALLSLAGGLSATGSITVLLGNGDGTFQPPSVYSTGSLSRGYTIVVGDFNHDGILDGAAGGSSIQVFTGKGDGTFTGRIETGLNGAAVSDMTAADFNRDGKLDLAVATNTNLFSGALSIYLGNGDGTFQASASAVATGLFAVASGDLNGDGLPDLAVATTTAGNRNIMQVFLSNGDGTFHSPVTYALPRLGFAIVIADLNGDRKPDIVVGSYELPGLIASGSVTAFLGAGDGSFAPGITSLTGVEIQTMAIADFTGDGHPDVAFTQGVCCLSLAAGDGKGRFESFALYRTPAYAYAVFAADFEASGRLDLAVLNGAIDLFPGAAGGDFETPLASPPNGFDAIYGAVADFNGDGIPDLAAAGGSGPDSLRLYFGQRGGNFIAGTTVTSVLPQISSMVAADFNGDGNQDLAISSAPSGNFPGLVQILLGDGKGNFKIHSVIPFPGSLLGQIVAADFNGDGKMDLAVANRGSAFAFLLLIGKGDGAFQSAVGQGTSQDGTGFLAVGDLNHDGKLDVVASDGLLGYLYVSLGNGNGTFQPTTAFPSGLAATSLSVADFNCDGNLDVAATGGSLDNVSIYAGDGFGALGQPVSFSTGAGAYAMAVGDFNGDGKPDIAAANNNGRSVSVLLNTTRCGAN